MPESPPGSGRHFTTHRLWLSDLDALATGHAGSETVERILVAERSRRLLMLRALVDRVPEDAWAPFPPATAMEVLVRAERASPDAVTAVLDHSGTGVWAVRALERVRGGAAAQWRGLGYLHALAAAAALRAGVRATLRLPVEDGEVVLPTLGRARLPVVPEGGTSVAELRAAPGSAVLDFGHQQVRLPAELRQATDGWRPLSTVSWMVGAPPLVLEDSDSFRDLGTGHAVPRLTGPEAGLWRGLLREAGELLLKRHPRDADMVSATLRRLVPLPAVPPFRTESASHTEAFGAALISRTGTALELAETLVHEVRHSVLNGLLHQVPLAEDVSPDGDPIRLYAPWRSDPRPPSGTLHGVYAFGGVADFWRVERHALHGPLGDLANFEFAVWRAAVRRGIDALVECGGLTALGDRFVSRLALEYEPWADEAVPERPLALAREESADRWSVWRARNTRPGREAVRTLARYWQAGADPETVPRAPLSRLREDGRPARPHQRVELRRLWITDPEAVAPHALRTADVHLLRGETALAVKGYQEALDAPDAWAGLGLALDGAGESVAADALLLRPEVVIAIWDQVRRDRAPDPVALADWIGRIPEMFRPEGQSGIG